MHNLKLQDCYFQATFSCAILVFSMEIVSGRFIRKHVPLATFPSPSLQHVGPSSFRFFSQLVLLPPLPLKASQSESVLLSSQTCLDLRLGIGGNSFLSLYPDINCKVPEKPSLFKDVTTLVRP